MNDSDRPSAGKRLTGTPKFTVTDAVRHFTALVEIDRLCPLLSAPHVASDRIDVCYAMCSRFVSVTRSANISLSVTRSANISYAIVPVLANGYRVCYAIRVSAQLRTGIFCSLLSNARRTHMVFSSCLSVAYEIA